MAKTILLILQKKRRETATAVQSCLTEFGCIIRTRLGIHDGVPDKCTNEGLIILEMVGERTDMKALENKLDAIHDVRTKLVDISFDDVQGTK